MLIGGEVWWGVSEHVGDSESSFHGLGSRATKGLLIGTANVDQLDGAWGGASAIAADGMAEWAWIVSTKVT
jgi:hypothetical protein